MALRHRPTWFVSKGIYLCLVRWEEFTGRAFVCSGIASDFSGHPRTSFGQIVPQKALWGQEGTVEEGATQHHPVYQSALPGNQVSKGICWSVPFRVKPQCFLTSKAQEEVEHSAFDRHFGT